MSKNLNWSRLFGTLIVIITIAAVVIVFSLNRNRNSEEIKIGVVGPFSGPIAFFGEDMMQAMDLAVEEVNSKGGVNNKKIKFIYEDADTLELSKLLTGLNKLKNVDNVVAILGPFSGSANKIAGDFSKQNKIFMISPGDNFGKLSPYKFNTRYLLDTEAELLTGYALKQGWKKVAILYFNNDWGLQYRDTIKKEIENAGGELVGAETYDYSNLDVSTQLLKLKSANPDVIVIIDSTRGQLFKQAKELGITTSLLSEWEVETALNEFGDALEGVVYALPVTEETEFYRNFRERYNEEPNVINLDSYDSVMILVEALENCENYNVECMSNYVSDLKDYRGAGGVMSFDKKTWSFDKPFVMKTIKDGTPVVLED